MTDPPRRSGALFTDLYELTMLQAYDDRGMDGIATFELMFRELPAHRSYLVTCGVETVLEFLESLAFDDAAIDFLARQGSFRDQFLDRLRGFRFTGDVWAMPEGTIAFPPAPLLQVVAPIGEAQVVETFALMQMHFQTGVASKASRIASAAQGRTVVDFGSRRAQGGALEVARAAYIGGLDGTSNLEAGRRYGIPVFGTMAHSYVEAVGDELEAFRSFATLYPGTTLLVDTYDTRRGIDTVIRLARGDAGRAPGAAGGPRPHREPLAVGGIRLDSGDLGVLAVEARQALDAAGLEEIQIFASGSLDEWRIASLLGAGVPIDGFGVGTRLAVVADAPAGDAVYKLVEYAGLPRLKLSSAKETLPGRKQVYRTRAGGRLLRDVIALNDEQLDGEPLLVPVMRGGRRVDGHETADGARDGSASGDGRESAVEQARARHRRELESLAPALRRLEVADRPAPVTLSPRLRAERDRLTRELERS